MTQTNPITSSDLKSPLIHAVAGFLQAKGFSKTFKKFLSEASIEKNGMDSLLDLEVMYHKYAEICNKDKTSVSNHKENGNVPAPESDAKSKDKKKDKNKGNKVSDTSNGIELESELPRATKENVKDHTSVTSKDVDDFEAEQRSKDNKKMKHKSNDSNQTGETIANGNLLDVKPKIKKNKKGSSGGEGKKVSVVEDASDTFLTKEDVKISDVDATGKEDESSKKRKRCYSEKNDSEPVKNKEFESDEKSSMRKRIKKQQNDSTEPKTVKTFQRVKAEEVVFTDEKLKDNSYWAKDGAEIGYGAKAQEVLGQVRGRDFRHEKTKKKRGSYRGGQIDLQSHSVKFNYSDEE